MNCETAVHVLLRLTESWHDHFLKAINAEQGTVDRLSQTIAS